MAQPEKSYLKVVHYIQDRLIRKKIRLGDRLPTERELSSALNLSRNSIREAFRTLENMGLLESRQGSGNYLVGNVEKTFADSLALMLLLERIQFSEIGALRRALETEAFKEAVKCRDARDLDALEKSLSEEEKEIKKEMKGTEEKKGENGVAAVRLQAGREFHRGMIRASHNRLFLHITEAVSGISGVRTSQIDEELTPEERLEILRLRRQIFEALRDRDETAGNQRLRAYFDLLERVAARLVPKEGKAESDADADEGDYAVFPLGLTTIKIKI